MQNVPKDEAVCEGKRWEGRWCQDVVVVGCKTVNAGVLDSSSPAFGWTAAQGETNRQSRLTPLVRPSCRAAAVRRLACFGLGLVASWRADTDAYGARPALVGETHGWRRTRTMGDGEEGGGRGRGGGRRRTEGRCQA